MTSHVSRASIQVVNPFSSIQKSVRCHLFSLASRILTPLSRQAGGDATEAFYSLHRHEVLDRPQYQRLQIGVITGEEPTIHDRIPGEISKVPYAEPTWLSKGYHSPYYTDVRCFIPFFLPHRAQY